MNLTKHFNLITVLFAILFIAFTTMAQDVAEKEAQLDSVIQSEGNKTPISAVVSINGNKNIAQTVHDFEVLDALSKLIYSLKVAKSEKKIDSLQYEKAVATNINKVQEFGIYKTDN